jgi:hypothetical protein
VDRFDRIYALHRLLAGRRVPISEKDLETALECSRATVIRTIGTMRTFLNAPIEYDRDRNGYHYASGGLSDPWELPGLWFSAAELQALLALEHLLADLSPGLLAEELNPFRERIEALLHRQDIGTGELYRRLRMLGMGRRAVDQALFRGVTSALSQRRRLKLGYRSRSRDQATERIVSPQRLVHYRDNWYLDAWCHMRDGLRIFALDRMLGTEVGAGGWQLGDLVVIAVALLAAVWGAGIGLVVRRDRTWMAMLGIAGTSMYVVSVVVSGFGYGYKATFLLLLVPLLAALLPARRRLIVASALAALLLVVIQSVVVWNTVLATTSGVVAAGFGFGLSASIITRSVRRRASRSDTAGRLGMQASSGGRSPE